MKTKEPLSTSVFVAPKIRVESQLSEPLVTTGVFPLRRVSESGGVQTTLIACLSYQEGHTFDAPQPETLSLTLSFLQACFRCRRTADCGATNTLVHKSGL
jgi:hypothetical protein